MIGLYLVFFVPEISNVCCRSFQKKKDLPYVFNAMRQIGELEDTKAFILDVTWPEMYPEMAPKISLDAFFNNRM